MNGRRFSQDPHKRRKSHHNYQHGPPPPPPCPVATAASDFMCVCVCGVVLVNDLQCLYGMTVIVAVQTRALLSKSTLSPLPR